MSQNKSSAVMQQRSEAHDSLDDFPTPPWGARALVEHVLRNPQLGNMSGHWDGLRTCWEPTANRGYLMRGLDGYFSGLYGSDIHDYGAGFDQADFLWHASDEIARFKLDGKPDWIIANPPFRLAEQFIRRACDLGPARGVAMLVRTSFLEGVGRYNDLYTVNPPTVIAQFSERLPMVKGRVDADASTATSYCWLVWLKGAPKGFPKFMWIPPCRKQLERGGDYA